MHDAARPLVTRADLVKLIAAARSEHGALLATPVTDTLKDGPEGLVQRTVPRAGLWRALTPQAFPFDVLRDALRQAGPDVTDEASAVEALGRKPRLVAGSAANIKITRAEDLDLARRLLGTAPARVRVGSGYDVHRFGDGDFVTLGGVAIAHTQGLLAHSDGDVLLHAICDALLGAAALGDIGHHFPPEDERWRGADSRDLLRRTIDLLAEREVRPVHIDATVIAERPRLKPHIAAMQRHIAADTGLDLTQVSIKATTTEGLGFAGRGEGIAAQAVATVL